MRLVMVWLLAAAVFAAPPSARAVVAAGVTVEAGTPPDVTIDSPSSSTHWRTGEQIGFAGHAVDAKGASLPASSLSWTLESHHCVAGGECDVHIEQTFQGVASGSFTAPNRPYPAYLELVLTAVDADGLDGRTSVRLDPQTVDLTFATDPPGLPLTVGGDTATSPFTRTMIVSSTTTVTAPVPQPLLGPGYLFAGWSDGGAATHDLAAPATATTYTARYARFPIGGLPPGGTPETPTPPGPVAAYGFEDARGAAVGDASGHGNTGSISGARRTAAGRFGRALRFDGDEDWVTVPDAPSLRLRGGMTVEAWVYPTARRGAWRSVAVKERRSGLAYGLYATAAGRRPAGTAAGHAARGTASLPIRRWSHLAVTFDGARLVLYVNGTAIASRPAPGTIAGGTEALRIGGNAVWDEWFAGRIDEVRIYDRALGASAVRADMVAAVGPASGRVAAPRVPSLRAERRRRGLPLASHSLTP